LAKAKEECKREVKRAMLDEHEEEINDMKVNAACTPRASFATFVTQETCRTAQVLAHKCPCSIPTMNSASGGSW